MGMTFAPNHKGMQIVDGDVAADDFLRRQVLTSRNVLGGRIVAAASGSLNYQIEHHLFPSMPSRHLRRARPMVRSFCAEHQIAYCETNVFTSYRRVLSYLHGVQPGGQGSPRAGSPSAAE
jgi:fatty acid desaturase